ncbi:hypothetical protein [Chryseobacterium chendengshani]|uniref:hypothetical protein n=1 Tax=unclassified Chryseobacterium TaxID=2593645 RepID=UPI001C6410A6|nr:MULTISPECIES: hypothetical protein [unclassified Chryseobacterium]MBW7676181.1 hypothetical protein [Chryseobacterium sp. LJ756]MBW8524208.1 hypothetical protein [Chryseobacterium sp. LJ668]QYK17139.1 hypothetical protein K0U91_03120 [Chryseobacterium sp. LJ668]
METGSKSVSHRRVLMFSPLKKHLTEENSEVFFGCWISISGKLAGKDGFWKNEIRLMSL